MGLITNLEKSSLKKYAKQNEIADSFYYIFEKDGTKYFQINTTGSNTRKDKGKVSQTMQFSEDVAKKLFEIMKDEFGFK